MQVSTNQRAASEGWQACSQTISRCLGISANVETAAPLGICIHGWILRPLQLETEALPDAFSSLLGTDGGSAPPKFLRAGTPPSAEEKFLQG